MGVWAKDVSGAGGRISLKFEWEEFSSGGETWPIQPDEFIFPVTSSWAYYEASAQAPFGVMGLTPVWGTDSPGTEIGIDDVSLVLPEPMSIALLSLGALALRRRK